MISLPWSSQTAFKSKDFSGLNTQQLGMKNQQIDSGGSIAFFRIKLL
jgi:hypothetical protein